MDELKSNLRQEHWEVLNWMTKCFEVTTPVQTARFMLGSHPRWCAGAHGCQLCQREQCGGMSARVHMVCDASFFRG